MKRLLVRLLLLPVALTSMLGLAPQANADTDRLIGTYCRTVSANLGTYYYFTLCDSIWSVNGGKSRWHNVTAKPSWKALPVRWQLRMATNAGTCTSGYRIGWESASCSKTGSPYTGANARVIFPDLDWVSSSVASFPAY